MPNDLSILVAIATCIAAVAAIAALAVALSNRKLIRTIREMTQGIADRQKEESAADRERFDSVTRQLRDSDARGSELRRDVLGQFESMRKENEAQLDKIRGIVDEKLVKDLNLRLAASLEQTRTQLEAMRKENEAQLDKIRGTVDEKLSKTLNDRLTASFKQVSDQLEAVHKGLGDMQNVASSVGDLKRVLGNVKTRGMLGEVQLGAILSDILTPEQYDENVVTKPGSSERVEYAVKLPVEKDETIYLPIDAKFPGDAYSQLQEALDTGDKEPIAQARKALANRVKGEAKSISEKYVSPPDTTGFAIMFLPFEGLYAEVVNMPGLVECLSRDYRVNVAGPSTMSAILNSLQMSCQTFKLQKQTDEVLRVLSAVKAELPVYQKALETARKQIRTAGNTVDSIITTRTNQMERKLRNIGELGEDEDAERILGISGDI